MLRERTEMKSSANEQAIRMNNNVRYFIFSLIMAILLYLHFKEDKIQQNEKNNRTLSAESSWILPTLRSLLVQLAKKVTFWLNDSLLSGSCYCTSEIS